MKNIFKAVIEKGDYDLTALLKKIDTYHIEGKIADEEKEELYALARANADGSSSIKVFEKLSELERRIKKLEQSQTDAEEESGIEEYKPGKWYYAGDKMIFEGRIHRCTAPEGVVCVWSPIDYPEYWEVIE